MGSSGSSGAPDEPRQAVAALPATKLPGNSAVASSSSIESGGNEPLDGSPQHGAGLISSAASSGSPLPTGSSSPPDLEADSP